MKAYNLLSVTIVLTLFLFSTHTSYLYAQSGDTEKTGKITGKVVDDETGEALPGVNVVISGTSKGTATDLDGRYTISRLEPGTYSITISYISYTKQTITDIEVESGESATVNGSLVSETLGLDEITVTAEANRSSEAGLLSIQRKAIAVQDGLSYEQISKSGDSNVASAVKRVTGVTLVNGNDVFVRGLGNRYSNVQLNNAPVPSTSPNKKEAPVDLISSGLVQDIVVQKTYTPDQTGEFSGGALNITTKEFPDARNISFGYATSYNSVSTFEDMLTYPGSSTDFLGFDDGKRSLPEPLNGRVDENRLTRSNELEVARLLHNDWSQNNNVRAMPSQSFKLNYANQFNEDRLPVGIISNLSYKYENQFRGNQVLRSIESVNRQTDENVLSGDFIQNQGIESSNLSGMVNIFLKPSPNTKIGLKNLYSNSMDNTAGVVTGIYTNASRENRQTLNDFDRKNVYSSSLNVETALSDFYNSRLEGSVSYSRAFRDRPDRRATHYSLNDSNEHAVKFSEGGNNHFFSSQVDNNYTGKLDYRIQPANALQFKTGVFGLYKQRTFNARILEYQDFQNRLPSQLATASPDLVLSDESLEDDYIDLAEITTGDDNYEGEQFLTAAYFNTKLNLGDRFSIDLGGRIETSDQKVDGRSVIDKMDFLPASNLTYNLSQRSNLRGAFSMTLARPEFREVSNFSFQDFVGSRIVYGNPDLERTRILNYDLRYELFPNSGELFAVSAFYKQFHNPIEMWYRITERTEVKYNNGEQADLYGFEFEARKNVTPQLQFITNASYIISEVDFSNQEDEVIGRLSNLSRPMFGQSPYTLNASVYYTIPSLNMDLNLSYNTFGERIVTIGKRTHPDDEYEQPFHSMNLRANYNSGRFTFSAGVENLLNDDVVYEQGNVTTYRYKPGITYDFGITYNL